VQGREREGEREGFGRGEEGFGRGEKEWSNLRSVVGVYFAEHTLEQSGVPLTKELELSSKMRTSSSVWHV